MRQHGTSTSRPRRPPHRPWLRLVFAVAGVLAAASARAQTLPAPPGQMVRSGSLSSIPAGASGGSWSAPPAGARMGVLTTPTATAAPVGTITVVGEVERPAVLSTREPHPRLDTVLQRAGGLTSAASGSLTIFRSGQPRIQLTLRDALRIELQHGDVILVSPAWVPPSPEQAAQPRPVTLVCHNLGETPRLLRVPATEASIAAVAYRLGQVEDAIPPAGVVLPAQQPTLSRVMRLPSGTMLYFAPRLLNQATLHAMLAVRDPFDPVIDLDAPEENGIGAAGYGGLTPVGPIHPSVLLTPPSGSPRATAHIEPAAPLPESAVPFRELTLPDPDLAPPQGDELAVLNTPPAVSETPRSLVPAGMSPPPATPPAKKTSASPTPKPTSKPLAVSPRKIEPASSTTSWTAAGFGWGVGLGVLLAGTLGLSLWIRRQLPKRPAPTPLDLPVRQQPAAAASTRLHGAVVGDRNLRVDPPHESLAGPHFGRVAPTSAPAPTPAAASVAARTSAMQVATASIDRPLRPAGEPAKTVERAPVAPAAASGEGSGLLDRVLRAMQRERDT